MHTRPSSTTALRLLALVAPYSGWFALAVLLGFATVGSSIGLITTSAYLIARAALMPSIDTLNLAIVGVRFFGIARGLLRYAERYVAHSATFRLLAGLRTWFYSAVEPLAPAGLIGQRSGDLLSRVVADVETLEQFYLRVLAPPLVALLNAALSCAIMLAFDPRLALALLLIELLAGLGVPLIVRRLSRNPGVAMVHARAALSAGLVESIQSLADLLILGRERDLLAQVREQSVALAKAQERLAALRGLGNALVGLLSQLAAVLILLIAVPLVRAGQIDGVYLAMLTLGAVASFEALTPLAAALQSLEVSMSAARRLFALADEQPAIGVEPDQSPAPIDGSIELRGLSFSYPGASQLALDAVSLKIEPDQRVAIIGPSGAGKSTIVNLLLRFWDYQQGSIRLGGHELRAYRGDDARQLIGVVTQQTYLFNGTLRENLLLARPTASDSELADACRRARLDELIDRLPAGYDTWIGEQGMGLSGGERQRLAIARALLKDAPFLILDEPTAQLDAATAGEILSALSELTHGRTTLLITHQQSGLEDADRIVKIDQGRIVK